MLNNIKVVSFDVEGTLVTTDFSYAIWFEMIPQHYAARYDMEFQQALPIVQATYGSLTDDNVDWYNVQYWFDRFDLGKADIAMEGLQHRVEYYPDTHEILSMLTGRYQLNVASGSPHHFLTHLLRDIQHHFSSIFSSISDYKEVKTADFYRYMCQQLQVEPEQVVHIGDNLQYDFIEPGSIGINAFYLDRTNAATEKHALNNLLQLYDILH